MSEPSFRVFEPQIKIGLYMIEKIWFLCLLIGFIYDRENRGIAAEFERKFCLISEEEAQSGLRENRRIVIKFMRKRKNHHMFDMEQNHYWI